MFPFKAITIDDLSCFLYMYDCRLYFGPLPFAVYDNLSFKYQLGDYTGDYNVGL